MHSRSHLAETGASCFEVVQHLQDLNHEGCTLSFMSLLFRLYTGGTKLL